MIFKRKFAATFELGRKMGAEEEREYILQLAQDASIENDNGRFVYLSDLEDYIDFADQEKQNQS